MIEKRSAGGDRRGLLVATCMLLLLLLGGSYSGQPASAGQAHVAGKESAAATAMQGARVIRSGRNDTSAELRVTAAKYQAKGSAQAPLDPAAMPPPGASFDGVANADNRGAAAQPDTAGDVGRSHYVQWVKSTFAVYDKNGARVLGPLEGSAIWDGFGGPCDVTNDGDPVVLYDTLADRWLLSQFSLPNYPDPPYYQCVAVSATSDPTGSYHRYEFLVSDRFLNNIARFGLWPNAYFASFGMIDTLASRFEGSWAVAFERAQMLAGQPAAMQVFQLSPTSGHTLPSDMDGLTPPPPGEPNVYAALRENSLRLYKYHVDWDNPANSTFSGPVSLAAEPFAYLCLANPDCIPQPGGAPPLQATGDRLMNRLAYRNFGSSSSLLATHSVDLGAVRAAMRWYEIRNPAAAPAIAQQGTYSPDAHNRWTGSIAMDRAGNVALGYNVSSSTVFPGIRYTGRLAGDPAGTMPQGEQTLVAGGGAQLPFSYSSENRWGESSVMSVDPADDCTFWFSGAYVQTTGEVSWRTRIGSFRFPECAPLVPSPTPTGTPPTPASTPTPRNTATSTPPAGATPTVEACHIYNFTQTGGQSIVPGTADIGNHCDECATRVELPFAFTLYDQAFNSVLVSPNGSLSFLGGGSGYNNYPLPYRYANYAIFAFWDDQVTTQPGTGIFTSVSGAAPNRVFNVEWRTCLYADVGCGGALNYQVRLYEGHSTRFDVVYGNMASGGSGATVGVQRGHGSSFTQFSYNANMLTAGTQLTFRLPECGVPCPITFSDVRTADYFYSPVRFLFCEGAVSGYSDNTFRPFNNTTRGQLTKIIVASRGWPIDTAGGPHFRDVPASNPFYSWIETAHKRGIISGYDDGTFRWNNDVTRGQLSKIIVQAMNWRVDTAGGPHFADVAENNPFYPWIETAYKHEIISGYNDGTFRWGLNATRGQISKIVYLAVTYDR